MSLFLSLLCGSSSATPLARPTTGTGVLLPPLGSRHRTPRWCGLARRLRRAGCGTGTTAPVPAPFLFLRCLLSEASWLVIDAHRRYRQWHAPGWFSTVHDVFPFFFFFDRSKMLGFLVGMDQKGSYSAWLRPRSSPTSTVALSWLVLLVSWCVSLHCPQAQDARHLVRYGPEGQFYSEILAPAVETPWYLAVTFSACLTPEAYRN